MAGALNTRLPRFMRWLGDLETRILDGDLPALRVERPVYVCGLARSGTTLLLEALAAAPDFTTHRYSDYPLLWTPYWWNWLRARLPLPTQTPVERAHRDRLVVTANSPEAFEEVFWMHFFPGRHEVVVDQIIDATCDNQAFADFYAAHIHKLLAVRRARRYLAKGNYNLTRIGYLRRLFPDARFVIAVREPHAHVASLVKQDGPVQRLGTIRSGDRDASGAQRPFRIRAAQACGECRRPGTGGGDSGLLRIRPRRGRLRTAVGVVLRMAVASVGRRWRFGRSLPLGRVRTLVRAPGRSLQQVYAHAGLDADTAAELSEDWAGRIVAPDYYTPGIDPAGKKSISAITGRVWRCLLKGCRV